MKENQQLKDKIFSGERIDKDEALQLFKWSILELGNAADKRRKLIHTEETVGFIIDRIINFTNICEAKCNFCAFHAKAGSLEPYELTIDEILDKVKELVDNGGSQVMLQGGLHPDYKIDHYIHLIKSIKEKFPHIYLHSLSPAEVVHISKKSELPIDDVVAELKKSGLNSIPGASDMLVDRVRKIICPVKITKDEWLNVIRALKKNKMGSTATMTYGLGETLEERIEHLDVIRSIQDETGILRAFIPWSFSPNNTEMQEIVPATGMDYLKILAVSRIYLDNIKYIQAGWLTEGLKLAQIALSMGANDMGGVLTEEIVVKATGIGTRTTMEELIGIIKNAGKKPVLRDSEYNIKRAF